MTHSSSGLRSERPSWASNRCRVADSGLGVAGLDADGAGVASLREAGGLLSADTCSEVSGVASLVVAGGLSLVIGDESVVASLVATGCFSSVAGDVSVEASLEVVGTVAGRSLARKASKPGNLLVAFHCPSAREDQAT